MDLPTNQRILLLQHERELVQAGFTRRPNELGPYPSPTKNLSSWWHRPILPDGWLAAVKKCDIQIPELTPFKMHKAGWFHLGKGRFIPPYLLAEALDYSKACAKEASAPAPTT